MTVAPTKTPIRLLGDLLDDADFQRLASQERRFNVFDALGVQKQEVRHSDFLSYILDPNRPHGIGPEFLRRFLLRVSSQEKIGRSPFDGVSLRLEEWKNITVAREKTTASKGRIDLLIERQGSWAVVIENKVGAGEHGNQLEKYEAFAREELPCPDVLMLFLTPEGAAPSRDGWISVGYGIIVEVVQELLGMEEIPERTRNVLRDYSDYVEAYVMEDSEVADLCRRVYDRHREAIDLLMEHIPQSSGVLADATNAALERMRNEGEIMLDDMWNNMHRWWPKSLEHLVPMMSETSPRTWTKSRRGILVEMGIAYKRLRLAVIVGPFNETGQPQLLELVEQQGVILKDKSRAGAQFWRRVYQEDIISEDDAIEIAQEGGPTALETEVQSRLQASLEKFEPDLHKVLSAFQAAEVRS